MYRSPATLAFLLSEVMSAPLGGSLASQYVEARRKVQLGRPNSLRDLERADSDPTENLPIKRCWAGDRPRHGLTTSAIMR